MRLLDILPKLEKFQRVIKKDYPNEFIVRSCIDDTLIVCNFESLQMAYFTPFYQDLICDDWEVLQ